MKKVLVIADFDEAGGTGTYFRRLLEYLPKQYSVHVVMHGEKISSPLIPFVRASGASFSFDYCFLHPVVEHFVMRVFRKLGLSLIFNFAYDYLARLHLEKKYKPDLYCISQGGGCRYFAYLFGPTPTLIVMHSLFTGSIYREHFGFSFSKLLDRVDTRIKRVSSVSNFACNLFSQNIHAPGIASSITMIANYGLDFSARVRNGRDKTTILTMGHVVGYKNPDTWLAVASQVAAFLPGKVEFVWAGSGSMLEEMQKKTAGNPAIRFIGFNSDIADLYAKADIYFQPSIWESQGICVVEAMACKLPCIVSSAGGLPESIEDGKEGFVCQPMDISGYIEKMITLIHDENLRIKLGNNARMKYQKIFSRERWEGRMDSVLAEITAYSNPKPKSLIQ